MNTRTEARQLAPVSILLAMTTSCPIASTCSGLGNIASWWPDQNDSCAPSTPPSCLHRFYRLILYLQRQSHRGSHHKSNQLNRVGMSVDDLSLHRYPGQEATIRNKTSQRPLGRGIHHLETTRYCPIKTLTSDNPPGRYSQASNM